MAWYRCVGGAGGSLKLRTASGRIATFTTNMVEAFKSLKSDINPVQSGTGTPSPQNVRPISGFSALNVTRTGKNLFNKATITLNNFINANGSIQSSNGWSASDYISVKPNTTYYLSGITNGGSIAKHAFYKADKTFISAINNTTYQITTPNECCYIRLSLLSTSPDNAQLELGSTATDFEPYNGQTATVNFGQTVYKGVLDVTNGKVTVTHGYLFVDGSTSVVSVGQASGLNYVIVSNTGIDSINTSATHPIVSNEFDSSTIIAVGNAYITGYGKTLVAILPDQTVTTVAQANTWFSNNNAQFVYELATPIEIDTTPENLSALSGQTNNVYSDTNGDTEVKYLYRE